MVIGATGRVGSEVCREIIRQGYEVVEMSRQKLDITNLDALQTTLQQPGIDFVVNTAAFTNVDDAENCADACYAVNRDGVSNIALVCKQLQIPLLHISSDYVFDGAKQGAYTEDDPVTPIGLYGDSKWQGEQAIREIHDMHIILRSSWVFGQKTPNFVYNMVQRAKQQDVLEVVDDIRGCPTPASDIARVVVGIMEQCLCVDYLWGTYHYCSAEPTTRYEFAQAIVDLVQGKPGFKVKEVRPVSLEDQSSTQQERPLHSVLSCKKIHGTFGVMQRAWRGELGEIVKNYLDNEESQQKASSEQISS